MLNNINIFYRMFNNYWYSYRIQSLKKKKNIQITDHLSPRLCRCGRNDFVRVQYALGIHGVFQGPHKVDGLGALRILQIIRFLRTDPVLGTYAPAALGRPPVYERFD